MTSAKSHLTGVVNYEPDPLPNDERSLLSGGALTKNRLLIKNILYTKVNLMYEIFKTTSTCAQYRLY